MEAVVRHRKEATRRAAVVAVATAGMLATLVAPQLTTRARAADPLISQGKPTAASSVENAGTPASSATDGNTGTRWSSAFSDPQWLEVDLGATDTISEVVLSWEGAYGKSFQVQTSNDNSTWTPIYSTTSGTGGVQTLSVSGSGRYVRMYGTARGTGYGYSLWEFQVYGTVAGGLGSGVCPTQSDTPSFGPNVHVFDTTMSASTIQSQLDTDFAAQKDTNTAQFATTRVAELFKPGSYSVSDNVGFYTSVAGLGLNPDDVTINGAVTVDAFNSEDAGNATQNFWREADNLSINPTGGTDRWAVAQAGPFRRIDVKGSLSLFPASYGWASGGYVADTKVSGVAASASQQQFYTRDSNVGSWTGSNWNMVFSGVTGAPTQSFPNPPMTVLAATPVSEDVPYLYVTTDGKYHVFVPSLRTNATGTSWPNTAGTSLPMSGFYVVKSGDTSATINAALANGCSLLFTPGVYHLSQTLNVTKAGTVILGLGFPTLIPDGGVNTMQVADVDGVHIKGLLFDAGTTNSAALLTVGPTGASASHTPNPTVLQDVFFRVGGDIAGKATTSLIVNTNDTIIDDIWAWRADHGLAGTTGWSVNTGDQGVIVNGNNVEATGLFVEHYQKYEVTWNGQNGKTIFFQNEMPYDVPNIASWMNGTTKGYAAYKVASTVTTHEAWGVGSYCNFTSDPTVAAAHAFEVPQTAGVKLHDLLTVSLGGEGSITNIINTSGPTAQGSATVPVDLLSYP